jgi:hypothetical protein
LTTRGNTADSTPDAEVRQVLTRKTRKRWRTTEAALHLKRKPYEYQMARVMKAPPAGLEKRALDKRHPWKSVSPVLSIRIFFKAKKDLTSFFFPGTRTATVFPGEPFVARKAEDGGPPQ